MAIGTLRSDIHAFGNWLYSPVPTAEDRETAEEIIFHGAYHALVQAGGRMTTAKWQKAEYVWPRACSTATVACTRAGRVHAKTR
ncbi:hypothetical protein D3879_15630 [Pseudomonas cavernicola]|uniref:Uncharacterized protein n=1 Tax=Pseudomonas cavernicola TaxID=2320866 RepID=A0A418XF15_9PSED|nr:hypothetical protein D3879_15630 [Pseudomonas cavernicola]